MEMTEDGGRRMTLGIGLERDEDGILAWRGGRNYNDPGEAVKTWWNGKLRLGCTHSTWGNYSSHPCGKTPKHDPDAHGRPTKCGVHSASAKARSAAKQEEKFAAWRAKMDRNEAIRQATAQLELSLRWIAEGHNDPRALAQEIIAALDAARVMGTEA